MKPISIFGMLLLLAGAASAWDPYSSTLDFFQGMLAAHMNSTSTNIPDLIWVCFLSVWKLTYWHTQRLHTVGNAQDPAFKPQFILDTNHPWLTANAAWLSHYPNIGQELCDPDSSLWTTPFSIHTPPSDLFTNLSVRRNGVGGIYWPSLYVGWFNAHERLQELAACKAALVAVRNLHVDLYAAGDKYTTPSYGLTEIFSDVLAQMSNLETLDWDISSEATRAFEPAFLAKGLMLPSVKRLRPGAGSDFLVSICPNLEVIEAGSYYRHRSRRYPSPSRVAHLLTLIKASAGLKNLKEWHVSMLWDWWTLDLVQVILDATPKITGLHMEGNLYPVRASHEFMLGGAQSTDTCVEGPKAETLESYVNLLSRFPNLERLGLPATHELDLGFDRVPYCGNSEPYQREYNRWVRQDYAQATELAANITLRALPDLKSLGIGSEHGNLTVNDRGQPEMAWPWTGRMETYVYDFTVRVGTMDCWVLTSWI